MINFKQLKKVLDQGKKMPDPEKAYKQLSPLEKLFRETQAYIHQENYNISIEHKHAPSCILQEVQLFYARHHGLLTFCQTMQGNLAQLDSEYDTMGLRQQLAYTEQYKDYLKAMSAICQELMDFKGALEENQAHIIALNIRVQEAHDGLGIKNIETELEHILDNSALFEDQYQDFKVRQIITQSLAPFYETYQRKLSLLQADLEEAKDWLG